MPDLLRKIFLSDEEREATRMPLESEAATPAWDLPPTWQTAPVALALVEGEEVHSWNNACRTLLREVVGASDLASRRWLCASVTRLLATGRKTEVLAGNADTLSLEVRLGPIVPDNPTRVVALREVQGTGRGQDDLAETVSTLSHELRTPLTSMKSSLSLVLSGDTGPVSEEQTHFLGMTMRNISRLERLVSDLLDVSRTQVGEMVLNRREIDLGPVLRETVQMQEAAARQAGLELDYTGLPEKLLAHVDADKVVQILTNVVGNSIKYTQGGGLVRVWLESRPQPDPGLAWQLAEKFFLPLNAFNLVVEDSGVGMSHEDQDRVFEPWFRGAEDEERRHIPGAGLGLHITRSLVEAHGGRIRLASEPGQGTTVWIRLPRDPASEELLHGAAQLKALAGNWRTPLVAVLDGRASGQRPICPVRELATDFLRQQAGSDQRKIVVLAKDLVATVVNSEEDWATAWSDYAQKCGLGEVTPRWQMTSWSETETNKESISGPLGRNV